LRRQTSGRLFKRLRAVNSWLLVAIIVVASELLTAVMNSVQSLLRWGYLSTDLIVIGTVDAFVVSALVAPVVIYSLRSVNKHLELENAERRRSEAALKENEEKYRLLVDNLPVVIWTSDEAGNTTYISPTAEEIHGFMQEEIYRGGSELWFGRIHRDDVDRVKNDYASLFRDRGAYNIEYRIRDKHGSWVWVHDRAYSKFSESGRQFAYGVSTDITYRKKAEEALREVNNRLNAILQASSAAIYVMDRVGNVTLWNKAAEEMFGWKAEEVIGRINPIVPGEKLEEFRGKREMVLSGEPFVDVELSRRKRDGSLIDISVCAAALYDSSGTANGIMSVVTDITRRKRVEEELRKYRDHLEELVQERTEELSLLNEQLRQSQKLEAVGLLAGGIAHDFSNILATIKGSIYLIQKKRQEDDFIMKYAGQVLLSVEKATNLSQSLLSFSRRQTITLKPVSLNEIIRRIARLLSQVIGEDIEITMSLTAVEPTIMADSNQIEQVLMNMATNARDAMPEGGKLAIRTDVAEMDEGFRKRHGYGLTGRYALLTVSDEGTGMPEDVQDKIFEPFFTTKDLGKGSGLGLAVTYGIVKQHNGFIWVESNVGRGTTFRIYIPLERGDAVRPVSADTGPAAGGKEGILLAEDDADTRATMGEMLRMTGYEVFDAADGEEAVKVFLKNRDLVDLVLLDVRMPRKNGREVYEEIRRVWQGGKFLFMSGYTADIIDSRGIAEEGFNFISKAALPDEILKKVRGVLDS